MNISLPFLYPYDITSNKKNILMLFDRYLKRGYISNLMKDDLQEFGLIRIEQFVALLSSIPLSMSSSFDGLFYSEDEEIVRVNPESHIDKRINENVLLIDFIFTVSSIYNIDLFDTLNELQRFYFNQGCSDIYSDDGFKILKKDDFFYPIYQKIINQDIFLSKQVIRTSKSRKVLSFGKVNQETSLYLNLQKERYFEGMIINSSKKDNQIVNLVRYISSLFPIKDALLTIQMLIKLKRLNVDEKGSIILNKKEHMNFKDNLSWIKKSTWDEIYSSVDYEFDVDPIITYNEEFNCPICNSDGFNISPISLSCKKCKFNFIRTNLKSFKIKRIKINDILRGLKRGSLMIERDSGGYLPVFVNNEEQYYRFWIEDTI